VSVASVTATSAASTFQRALKRAPSGGVDETGASTLCGSPARGRQVLSLPLDVVILVRV